MQVHTVPPSRDARGGDPGMTAAERPSRPLTLRATSSQFAFWAMTVLAALLAADAAFRGAWPFLGRWAGTGLLLLWALWLVLYRSSVQLGERGMIVHNALRVHTIGWGQITAIHTGPQLTLELQDGQRLLCWGAPFPRRPGRSRGTQLGAQADIVRAWEQHAQSASEPDAAIHSRWDIPVLVVGVLLAISALTSGVTVTA